MRNPFKLTQIPGNLIENRLSKTFIPLALHPIGLIGFKLLAWKLIQIDRRLIAKIGNVLSYLNIDRKVFINVFCGRLSIVILQYFVLIVQILQLALILILPFAP